jgi:hypothetical protein
LDAYDSGGKVVGSAGEENGLPPKPQQFSIEGYGIVPVQLSTDNRFGSGTWATWNSLPVADSRLSDEGAPRLPSSRCARDVAGQRELGGGG